MDTFLFIIELLGTVAFAASGALTGIEKRMDIFGVAILGCWWASWPSRSPQSAAASSATW